MPIRRYGVVKGRVLERRLAHSRNPHYQILVLAGNEKFRASVNVKSNAFPSELLYLSVHNFQHPILEDLEQLVTGYTYLSSGNDLRGLDFIRGNLFNPSDMTKLPFDKPGPDNDLNEKLDSVVVRAISEHVIVEPDTYVYPHIYVFGERWGPESRRDKIFGFRPGNGIHDIHMNQGNMKRWQHDDGTWQDGGLVFYFPADQTWSVVFLAFQTQSFHTDDRTGMRLLDEPPGPHLPEPPAQPNIPARIDPPTIRILAALVNPFGNDFGKETVTIKNVTPDQLVDLSGWAIVDRIRRRDSLAGIMIRPGESITIRLTGLGAQLSNKGGTITLLNADGIKVDGVAYTRHQAADWEGREIVFFPETNS